MTDLNLQIAEIVAKENGWSIVNTIATGGFIFDRGKEWSDNRWKVIPDYLAPENLHELVRIIEEKGWEVRTDSWVDITGVRQRMVIIYPNYSKIKLEKVAVRSNESLQKAYAEAIIKSGASLAAAIVEAKG